MKERPILFNGSMVRAILEGRKTQTRRIIDMPRGFVPRDRVNGVEFGRITSAHPKKGKFGLFIEQIGLFGPVVDLIPCPYGFVGDRLYVRETWTAASGWDLVKPRNIHTSSPIQYKADLSKKNEDGFDPEEPHIYGKTRQSIHMPRWASRITLEITAVRVERVQDISEADAMAEGLQSRKEPDDFDEWLGADTWWYRPERAFEELWDSINGNRTDKHGNRLPYSWIDNPWAWVVEFKMIDSKKDC